VERVVTETHGGTSAFAKGLMRLLATAPGMHPVRMIPVFKFLSFRRQDTRNVASGIMVYCIKVPAKILWDFFDNKATCS